MGGRYLECASKLHGNPISFIDRAATVSSTPAFGFTMLSNKRCPDISRHLYITPGRQTLPVFTHLFLVHVLVGHSFYMSLKILYVYGCFVWISVCTPPMVSVRRCQIPWDWSLRWVQATLGVGSGARVLEEQPVLFNVWTSSAGKVFICVLVEALLTGKHSSRSWHRNEQDKVLHSHLRCFVMNIFPDTGRK